MVDLQGTGSGNIEENLRNKVFSKAAEYRNEQRRAEEQRKRDLEMQKRQAEQEQQAEDKEQQKQDDSDQIERGKEQIEEDKQAKIEALVRKRDEKIEKIENGPHGPVAFFATGFGMILFWLVAFIDGVINLLSGLAGLIPFLGTFLSAGLDGVEFFVNIGMIALFAIPTIFFLGDIAAFIKIVLFYIIDTATSFIPFIGDYIDAAFEFVVGFGFKSFSPPNVIKESYEHKKEDLKTKVRSKYNKKIAAVEEGARDHIRELVDGIKKKKFKTFFRGSGDVWYFVLIIITALIGPLGAGWISMDFKPITFSVIIIYSLILAFFYKSNALGERKIFSVVGFLLLMFVADLLLTNTRFTQSLFGNNSFLSIIILIMLAILDVTWAYNPEKTSSMALFFGILIALIFVGPQMAGYVKSGEFSSDADGNAAELEAGLKNLNPIDRFLDTIQRQYGYGPQGNVTVKGGEMEKTAEYIGAKIDSVNTIRNSYFPGQQIDIDIDTSANSYHPIHIATFCSVDNKVADTIKPQRTEVTGSKAARVRCTFDSLPKGSHVVDVEQTFRYLSSVKVPIKIITDEKEETLLALAQDAGVEYKPDNYIAGGDTPIATSGPIEIKVGNVKRDNMHVLETPIVINEENPNLHRRVNFKFQLDNTGNTESSKISMINDAIIDMPSGIGLQHCDFLPSDDELPYEQEGERWIYHFDKEFDSWDVFEVMSCDLKFHPEELSERFENDGWFFDKMYFTLDYNYHIERAATVRVE
ncbi:MAG: hypothetical protein ACQESE_01385 [Nanobdellota archaeon]